MPGSGGGCFAAATWVARPGVIGAIWPALIAAPVGGSARHQSWRGGAICEAGICADASGCR